MGMQTIPLPKGKVVVPVQVVVNLYTRWSTYNLLVVCNSTEVYHVLDTAWHAQQNIDENDLAQRMEVPSMKAGDYIIFDRQCYRCDECGWSLVELAEVGIRMCAQHIEHVLYHPDHAPKRVKLECPDPDATENN